MRAAYRDIQLYDPRRAPCEVDLSDNTNRFGVAPSLKRTLAELGTETITRYPSVFATRLREKLAELHNVKAENVTTGCGSDDVIDSAIRAFCEPGDAVAYPDPTFGIVSTFVRMNAARPITVPTGPDFAVDSFALRKANAALTYLCSPNNPTGTVTPRAVIEELDAQLDGLLLLDEAYAAFSDIDCADLAVRSTRTVSVRTLSKAWGLAGLRIGYAIGPAPLILEIEKSRGPYKVNGIAEAAALAALENDRSWVADIVVQTRQNRVRLARALDGLGISYWPSAANFILVQVPAGWSAESISTALRERGVAVRPFAALDGVGDCMRVSIGPWPLMDRFIEALTSLLEARAA